MNVHGITDDRFWFSQGGMVFQANLQNPILVYLKRHEMPAAIRSMYNNFVACLYPDANAFTEEYRQWSHASGPFYKTPDEARFVNRIRDTLALEEGDALYLASGVPRRWLESPAGIRVDRIATYFGPVSYTHEARIRAGQHRGHRATARAQSGEQSVAGGAHASRANRRASRSTASRGRRSTPSARPSNCPRMDPGWKSGSADVRPVSTRFAETRPRKEIRQFPGSMPSSPAQPSASVVPSRCSGPPYLSRR